MVFPIFALAAAVITAELGIPVTYLIASEGGKKTVPGYRDVGDLWDRPPFTHLTPKQLDAVKQYGERMGTAMSNMTVNQYREVQKEVTAYQDKMRHIHNELMNALPSQINEEWAKIGAELSQSPASLVEAVALASALSVEDPPIPTTTTGRPVHKSRVHVFN